MEQLNISQLRNLWLRSPDERLASWREFRIELQSSYNFCEDNSIDDQSLLQCLDAISTWWEQAPLVSMAIDPFNHDTWPTIWEIIHQGECCKYSRGLAMAYNISYVIPNASVDLSRVYDHKFDDEYMIALCNQQYALNSQHCRVLDITTVDTLEVRESWNVHHALLEKK